MSGAEKRSERKWAGRPRVARLLRFVVWLLPIVVSVATTHFVSRGFPRPPGLFPAIGWFVGLCVLATVILVVVDKLARRLLPLAALLQLSLVFPDSAPSRFKTALRTQTVHQLEMRVAEIKKNGLSDDPAMAAETLIELIAALSQHDRLTRGHAERVRAYSRMIGEEMKLPEADLDLLQWAGLAHDVGKLFISGEILNKTSRLTDDEYDIIKKHPGWGAELCEPLRPWLGDWVNAVGQHHERWDGKGYPNGLAGADISIAARIVSVADVFDVITSIRSYKAAGTSAEAREELARCAGTQFDERVVRAFLNISLGRLRLAMGPLSWMAQVPIVAQMPLVPVVGAATSMVVAGGAMLVGGTFAQADTPDVPAVVAAPLPETTLPPPLPSTTTPLVIVIEDTVPVPPTLPATTTLSATSTLPATTTTELAVTTTTEPAVTTTTEPAVTTTTTVEPAATTPVPATQPNDTTPETTTTTTEVPLAPLLALNLAATVDEDGAITLDVGNGSGPGVVARALTSPAHGVIVNGTGTTFVFTPDGDFNGQTTFTYELRDALGRTSVGSVAIDVLSVPDDPRAENDIAQVAENGSVVIAVLSNDFDPDGDSIRIVSAQSPNGTVTTDGDTIRYSPASDTFGTHQIVYIIEDATGRRGRGVVTVAVTPVNSRPVLADPGSKTVDEQATLSFVARASDPDMPLDNLTFSLVDGVVPVPQGASINPSTGEFSWTPTESQGATSYSFTLRVTDSGTPSLSDEVALLIDVNEVNQAPVLAPVGNRTTGEGVEMRFTLSASDLDLPADRLTYSASGLPPGAALNPTSGMLAWTPTELQGGNDYAVTVTVTDDGDGLLADSESVVLTATEVNSAPVLDDPGDQTVSEGALLSFVVAATDVDVPANRLTFSLADGLTPVPAGAVIDPVTGLFSWTPTESQGATSYSFKVRVTDDGVPNASGEVEVSFVVDEINQAPVLVSPGDRTVDEGETMAFLLAASDQDVPAQALTFSASNLPAGATLDPASGAFLWQPSEAQGGVDATVTFMVTDDGAGAMSDSATAVLSAVEVNVAPVLADPGDQIVDEGALLSFIAGASDADAPANGLTFTLVDGMTPVPSGATIDPATGAFSWTPSESQGATSYSFKLRVTDDGVPSLFAEIEIVFEVNEVNQAPVLAAIGNRSADEDATMSFTLTAVDSDLPADGLTFSATTLPAGASLDPVSGVFTWTPTELQGGLDFPVTFTVTDDGAGAMFDGESVVLSAIEVNTAPVLADPGGQSTDEGVLLSFVAAATDIDDPTQELTFALVDGVTPVPPGAAIDPVTGVFSWSPTETQGGTSYSFKVRVTDDGVPSLFHEVEVTFVVDEVNDAPVLSPIGNRTADENTAMSFTLAATDADVPANGLTFTATDLPAGATLDPATGAFTWTPSEVQGGLGFSVTFTVTDDGAGALFDDEVVVLTANEVNQAPTLTNPGNQNVAVGAVVSMNLTATDADVPANGLEFAATGLPPGLSIDTATGVISGSPTTIGSTTATVTVTETNGSPANLSDSVTFTWSVTTANIVISEIATSGPGGESDEFIELYNPTSSTVSVGGWVLRRSDGNMSPGVASAIPAGVSIGPNEYFLITHTSVRVALGADAWYSTGQLEAGAGVALFTNLGVQVDAVGTGPVPWKDGAGSLYGEGTYLPPMSGTVAQSYERKSGVGNCVDTNNNAADFFHNMGSRNPQGSGTTATCGTPTPPTPPPAPGHLVISEFRFDGPNGGSDEFVEIFNPTSLPIPLIGYELRNQSGVGPAEAVITLADLARLGTGVIGPGEHLVFGSADYDNGASAYDKVDIRTNGDIKNGGGVYLVAPAIPLVSPATVVDAVSTGGTVQREGTPLPPISGRVIHSYERRLGAAGGNCVDTDNNIADFFHNLGSENPQKLSAPATPCVP